MTDKKQDKQPKKPEVELTEEQLDNVAGGLILNPTQHAPKSSVPTSIAAGEITTDSLNDNLPGNGGGVIV
jgi:hypothetical protein